MTLTPALVRWLTSDEAATWLDPLTTDPPSDADLLTVITRLRKELSPDKAGALVEMARLRQHAAVKFPRADHMFFARDSLQQASAVAVAAHTARRFVNYACVADLGCGLGGDSLALAEIGIYVLAIDEAELPLTLVTANARALNLHQNVHALQSDVRQPAWLADAAWADPGRRTESRRLFDSEKLQPPLSALLEQRRWYNHNMGIKLMPGLAHTVIPVDAEAEWISLNGNLKQCVLWFGDLAQAPVRRATVLPDSLEICASGCQAEVRTPGQYLYEPDPAVIRSGAIADLALSLELWQIDSSIAYLSGDSFTPTPFARAWRIIEHHPFDLKSLNRRLRALQGRVIAVKKRGSPIEPEAFRRRLHHHPQGQPLVVVLTQAAGRPYMLICSPPLTDSV